MSSSLILSATRGHLHSVLPDVAVRMSSLAISVNLQPREESSVLPVVNRKRTAFGDPLKSPVAKSSLFLFLYFRVRRGSCFDITRSRLIRKHRSSDSYYRDRACASKGFQETDKFLDDFSPSPRSSCVADKARRTRHRLVSPSSHFLSVASLLVTSLHDDNTLLANYFAVTAEGHACYTKRRLALDSNRVLNVTEMSMRCRRRLTPSLNVPFLSTFHFAARRRIAVFRTLRIAIEFRIVSPDYSLFTQNTVIRLFI